ncbi:MAG TPA: hypothetical protein VIJ93_12080 [bacterium]
MEANSKTDNAILWWWLGGVAAIMGSLALIWWKLDQILEAIRGMAKGKEKPVIDLEPEPMQVTTVSNEKSLAIIPDIPPPFQCSKDFRLIKLNGEALPALTPYQAQTLKNVFELKEKGIEEFTQREVLRDIGNADKKMLKDTFKSNQKVFKALFERRNRRGIFRFKFEFKFE